MSAQSTRPRVAPPWGELRYSGELARLGDLGLPGMFSSRCRDGDCCADIRDELGAPLGPHIRAVAVYSRSDGVVDWRACLDAHAEAVEVHSSHCGMSVHTKVYELL